MKSPHYKNEEAGRTLQQALDLIKKEDAFLQPPAELEHRLLHALHTQHQPKSKSKFWYRAAAIIVLSILGSLIWILQPELRQNLRTQSNLTGIESDTGYVPLTYGLTPGESLQRVRVKLPRSALNEFGITLEDERTDEVTADLLVGESGLPYAVRVVHKN